MANQKRALMIGASGLVGSYLFQALCQTNEYSKITVLTRRDLNLKSQPQKEKIDEIKIDFDQLMSLPDHVFKVDDVFSCLGTTRRKTPDLEDYRKIEATYPMLVAERAVTNGARSFHYISSIGASEKSFMSYSRMKGETEEQLKNLQGEWPETTFISYRPSLITGPRQEQRSLEVVATQVWKVFEATLRGPLRKYRAIEAETIAQAMLLKALEAKKGFYVLESDEIAACV